jgi:hypothetical protein
MDHHDGDIGLLILFLKPEVLYFVIMVAALVAGSVALSGGIKLKKGKSIAGGAAGVVVGALMLIGAIWYIIYGKDESSSHDYGKLKYAQKITNDFLDTDLL